MAPGVPLNNSDPVCCAAVEGLVHKRHHGQQMKASKDDSTWDPDIETPRRSGDRVDMERDRRLRFEDDRRGPGTSSSSKAAAQAMIDPVRGAGQAVRPQEPRDQSKERRRVALTKPSADERAQLESGFRSQQRVRGRRLRQASSRRKAEGYFSYLDLPPSAEACAGPESGSEGEETPQLGLAPQLQRNCARQGGALPERSRKATEALIAMCQNPGISRGLDTEVEAELQAAEQHAEQAFQLKKAWELHLRGAAPVSAEEPEPLRMFRAIDVEVPLLVSPTPEPGAAASGGTVLQRVEAILGTGRPPGRSLSAIDEIASFEPGNDPPVGLDHAGHVFR